MRRSARKLLSEPSPSDWRRWEDRLLAGEEPSQAAAELGQTSSSFRRCNPDRHAACLAMSREARADYVDRTVERWALEPDAQTPMRLAWAKRWNPAYADKATLTAGDGGPVEVHVTFPQLQQLLERRVAVHDGAVADGHPVVEPAATSRVAALAR